MITADSFLGVPFNIASYALLVHMFCEVINNDPDYKGNKLTVGKLVMVFADTHIYRTHYSECVRQILREPYKFPQLKFNRKITDITDFKLEDIQLVDYTSHPSIVAKMVA